MKKYYYLITLLFFVCITSFGQKYKTEESYIKFYSSAPMEDIEAVNESSTSIIDMDSKNIVIVIPITSFEFPKELMQEHFNENYLESDKYPKATFKGKLTNWDGQEGKSSATAEGTLELHGVSKEIKIDGEIDKKGDALNMSAVFIIKLEDYKIKIPKAVFYKIAEEVEVTAKFDYKPYAKN
ncbi:YceI family protein [Ekhidna sp.]